MKNIARIAFVLTALALALILCLAAIAETVEPETPELPAVEDAVPAEEAPAEEAPTESTTPAADASADIALQDALNAYRAAKQSSRVENIESELNAFVASGKLTQEQADLILKYYKGQAALQNGTCPNCGYQFSSGKGSHGMGGRGGKGGRGGRGGKGMHGMGGYGYSAQGSQTQNDNAANGTAYEDMWTGMVSLDGIEEDI